MGTIDRIWHTFTCPKCGATETFGISDKGSNWSGSFWNQPPSLSKFSATWSGGGRNEPILKTAECLKCGMRAEVKERYAFDCPTDFK